MSRRWVPEPVRSLFGQRFFATGVLFGATAFFVGIFQPRALIAVAVVAAGTGLGLIFDLWRHSLRLENQLEMQSVSSDELATTVGELQAELADAYEEIERLGELEADNIRLTFERDELSARVKAPPPAMLEDTLRTLDTQSEIIGLIKKHRALQREGLWQWPVTSIHLHDEANVAVTAHADDPTRIAGEWVSLVDSGRGIVLVTVPAAGLENQLAAVIPLGSLPEDMQEALLSNGWMPVGGFVLRLGGLGVPPYDRLGDHELDTLLGTLRGAATAISNAVVGPGAPLALEEQFEEDE